MLKNSQTINAIAYHYSHTNKAIRENRTVITLTAIGADNVVNTEFHELICPIA